jgi:hypothetical protein
MRSISRRDFLQDSVILATTLAGTGIVHESATAAQAAGGSVQITSPTTNPTWTGPVGANFQLKGTSANQNVVEGSITDGSGGYGPIDCTPTGSSSPYQWTMTFNNGAIPGGHTLLVCVFDTQTGDFAQLTIYTTA